MIRLHVVVEGQTEETFVRDLLALDLANYNVMVDVHRITTGRKHGTSYRGGFVSYQHLSNDIKLWSAEDRNPDARFTSMIDLYKLPVDFPSFQTSQSFQDPLDRADHLESAFSVDLNNPRFIPYIQVHEFEALLFSQPTAFATAFPERVGKIAELQKILTGFDSPEHINDGETTSPAKRICALLPDYEKPASGPQIANQIGLDTIARECAHFRKWLNRLRQLSSGN